jgi:formylglycine-generating enzyme required for sulfatase activity
MGTSAGQLNDGLGNGTLATGFPIGYNSAGPSLNLYMMKHEVSQAAYRDFLNTLTYTQQVKRTAAAPNSVAGTMAIGLIAYRNGIKISTPGVSATTPAVYGCDLNNNSVYNETTDGEWVACGYLAYMDMAAFLDWAALRPMTELEFEKSCRGPLVPVSGEFAPGTATSSTYTFPLNNAGTTNESITYSGSVLNANINHNLASPGGNSPTRVGIHATAGATRISAGAGYYGVLDLSGNLLESCVTTGNVAGRSFTGVNGNGELNSAGDADVNFWPGINGNVTTTAANSVYGGATGVTGAAGIFSRGGACGYNPSLSQTSDRSYALAGTSTRIQVIGGRGVKSW